MSIRDILSWVQFINATACTMQVDTDAAQTISGPQTLDPALAYIHGACMVFLDALGSGLNVQLLHSCHLTIKKVKI